MKISSKTVKPSTLNLHVVFVLFGSILVFTLWFQLTLLLNRQFNLAQDQSIHLLFQRPIIIEQFKTVM